MQDVLVLLQHLTENEETTIKLMIECLYDVGTVNFINKKVQNDSINQFAKTLAGMSKPIAKRYGYYWFKKNCPELIVNWLKRKVAFPAPQAKAIQQQEAAPQVELAPVSTETPSPDHPSSSSQSDEPSTLRESTPSVETVHPHPAETPDQSIAPTNSATSHQEDQHQVMVSSVDDLQAESQRAQENVADPLPSSSSTNGTLATQDKETETTSAFIETVKAATSSKPEAVLENPPSSAKLPTAKQTKASPRQKAQDITQPGREKAQNKVLMKSFKVTTLPTPMEQKTTQIRRLKTQNKVLMGSLAGTILVGGLAIWQLHATQQSALQLHQSTPSSIVPASQSVE